ncbi:MAG: GNAT family N-acetyltransferase [Clostridiales bacterium]|nr:GNAT family N-acetyltransferase [Clostridiales bacterium]
MSWSNLNGQRIKFEPVTIEIAEDLHDYASNEDVSRFIGWPLMHTLSDSEAYVKKLIQNEKNKTHQYASVVLKENNLHIGTMMLFNFDDVAKHAEIGFVIHHEYWNKGYTTEAVSMILDYVKEHTDLHKLCARVVSINKGSSKVLLKTGFIQEGQLIDQFYIDGMYYDCLHYGLILD